MNQQWNVTQRCCAEPLDLENLKAIATTKKATSSVTIKEMLCSRERYSVNKVIFLHPLLNYMIFQ